MVGGQRHQSLSTTRGAALGLRTTNPGSNWFGEIRPVNRANIPYRGDQPRFNSRQYIQCLVGVVGRSRVKQTNSLPDPEVAAWSPL